ncbi:hypothetical protein IFO70_31220 [Phormidium tenue FACHB-886]|nr:hypothetical protein [Phormidium tenue FACHB-886]
MRWLIVSSPTVAKFEYIREWADAFLALFPHRYDYIWAKYPALKQSPEWKTESRHPLSDRLIQQNSYLYGVRFGAETNYCLLDIDTDSVYHPKHDPFAIANIAAALESLGLVSYVACTSSYSGGLHLYFPFQQAQSSWKLAIALSSLLESAGFKLTAGQLEVFPNPKPYSVAETPSLFNAHRLPLQTGSYLLNAAFQPIWTDSLGFVQQWQFAQRRNDLNTTTLKQTLKQVKRRHFQISGKADKFINDLNAEIEAGWTGTGQTNRLLGRITMRAYIFHHILSGGEPLQGKALVEEIVETARSLPGYRDWCRHQHEIEQRAEEWARCIENSHYFHYGDQNGKFKEKGNESELEQAIEGVPTWNQQQSEAARDRIKRAIADLLEKERLPAKTTARFHALLEYGIGGGSLYRHRDLWHPSYFVETSADPSDTSLMCQLDCAEDASNWHNSPSLLSTADGNDASGKDPEARSQQNNLNLGGNLSSQQSCNHSAPDSKPGIHTVQQALSNIRGQQEAHQEAVHLARQQQQRIRQEASSAKLIARMQKFLASGDPILIAEALAWAQVNPGVLEREQPLLNSPSESTLSTREEKNEIEAPQHESKVTGDDEDELKGQSR